MFVACSLMVLVVSEADIAVAEDMNTVHMGLGIYIDDPSGVGDNDWGQSIGVVAGNPGHDIAG